MSAQNDGGPAFPIPNASDMEGYVYASEARGMTLRDWFAGQALMGTIAFPIPGKEKIPNNAARECYAYADAMLAERAAIAKARGE